jgi:hypothetical protein
MPKRIDTRVMVHRRVEYQHARGQGDGMLLDLSLQGCRIKGTAPFLCGARLRLQLWLPDQAQPVKVELAAVRWVKDDQFGVSFLEMPPDARARLEQVVRLLQEAQQPEARVIQIPVSAFLGPEEGVSEPGCPHRIWEAHR